MRREWDALCKGVGATGLKPAGRAFWTLAMVGRIGHRPSVSAMP
jgi:hypothetical protein